MSASNFSQTSERSMTALLSQLQRLVTEHNESPLTPEGQRVPWETVTEKFVSAGMSTLATLAELMHEDLAGLPVGLVRALTTSVRSYVGSGRKALGGVSPLQAPRMSNEALIAALDPNDGTRVVTSELRKRLRDADVPADAAFVVMNHDGSIDPVSTLKCFEEVLQGEEPRLTCPVNGEELQVLPLGQLSNLVVDAHPLFADKYLRGDGTDGDGINWASLSLQVRQFLFLGRTHGLDGLNQLQRADAIDVFQEASLPNALAVLRVRYPNTWRLFLEQQTLGGLPNMKALRRSRSARRSQRTNGSSSVSNVARR